MTLEAITAQIKAKGDEIPPVELWDPPYCGEMDLQIKANGDWFHAGTIFKRPTLVKLLSSVLKKEEGEYFLVTPVEKIKITVDDAPFVLTQWNWQDENKKIMMVSNNVGDEFVLDANHPITLNTIGELYVKVRRNLLAKVHRNVYYQWIELAKETKTDKGIELLLTSASCHFSLGIL
jgi:hypothetical protein